jgi:hypothetical protein
MFCNFKSFLGYYAVHLILAVLAMIALPLSTVQAQSLTECQQLWLVRNSFFKSHGYCFKTPRAIAYFGNSGCTYQDQETIPLSRLERMQITQLIRREREISCPRDPGQIVALPSPGLPAAPNPAPPPAPTNPGTNPVGAACQKYPNLC